MIYSQTSMAYFVQRVFSKNMCFHFNGVAATESIEAQSHQISVAFNSLANALVNLET